MNTIKFLRAIFFCELLTAALLAAIFETGMLDNSQLAEPAGRAYLLEIAGVALTVASIPLAMKLMHFETVRRAIKDNEANYRTWSSVRLILLYASLGYNLLMYYLLGFDVTCGYLALMTVVAFFFVWPSRGRMEYECKLSYPQNEQ